MSVSGVPLSTGGVVAVIATVVAVGFLLLARRSAPPALLLTLTAVVTLSGVLAGMRLIQLEPTHAALRDSESTAPQTVSVRADTTETVDDAEAGELPTAPADDAVDPAETKDDRHTGAAHDNGGKNQGDTPDEQSPDSADADDPQGQSEAPSRDEDPATTPEQQAPSQPEVSELSGIVP